jgi:hypothetical protein
MEATPFKIASMHKSSGRTAVRPYPEFNLVLQGISITQEVADTAPSSYPFLVQ